MTHLISQVVLYVHWDVHRPVALTIGHSVGCPWGVVHVMGHPIHPMRSSMGFHTSHGMSHKVADGMSHNVTQEMTHGASFIPWDIPSDVVWDG